MATLKLNKKPGPKSANKLGEERRGPLRGKGVSRPRQTLEAAQAERAERQAAFEQRRSDEERPRSAAPRPTRPADRDGGPRFEDRRPQRRSDSAPARQERDERSQQRGPRPEFAGEPQRHQDPRREPSQRQQQEPRRDQRRATTGYGPRADARSPYPSDKPPARPQQARRQDDEDEDYHDPSSEGERLSKRLGTLGLASRREADEWIAAGWVRVDGKMAVLGQRVGPDAKIEIDQAAHKEQAKQVTILLNKPIGYVSGQAEDGYEPASVLVKSANHWSEDASGIKYHIGHSRGLAPAGRLDIDSTGLLVLTQDGRIAKILIGEDSKVEKEYLVRVEYNGQGAPMQQFPAQDLALLNHGLSLDDVQLKPAKVSWINDDQLRFVLREGRKRQIRRMCELVGLKVVGLKRVRIGRINLGHLPPGQWRFLTPWERFD
jgi:23S rRNA pseudouridine2604 synthase